MKKYFIGLFLIYIFSLMNANSVYDNFKEGNYKANVKMGLNGLYSADDYFYAGLSYFAFDNLNGWERGFYLFKKSKKYSQAKFLRALQKEFPKLFLDNKKLTLLALFSIYGQMYDFLYRILDKDYKEYLYEGNWDQWWNTCEEIRHYLKNERLHPTLISLVEKENVIFLQGKAVEFSYKNNKLSYMAIDNKEIRYFLQLKKKFLYGNVAKKYGKFKERVINISPDEINTGFKFKVYFGKIKAGYMYYFLKEKDGYYELYVNIRTTSFLSSFYKIRDYIYIKLRKSDFLPIYYFENLHEGSYKAKRWTKLDPENFKGFYKGKEGMGLGNFTQDSYSLLYLIKASLPNKLDEFTLISRKMVYPFELKYKKKTIKIKGKKIKGISVLPSARFKLNDKQKGFSGEFFFDTTNNIPIYSKTFTKYGTLTAYFEKELDSQDFEKEDIKYENFRN
ncbi:DUF3108 domain-containing protein [bacterium]|nr:DUF3108 domain-containing protein [bacterium]